MTPEILLLETMPPAIEAQLERAFTVHRPAAADMGALGTAVRSRIRAIATNGGRGAEAALIDSLPALEIVAVNGVGTDAVDLDRCRDRGIRVTTTPDILTDDVADMAMGLLIAVARRLAQGDRFVRAGQWPRGPLPLGRKVSGKRLGILGLGRIGRAVAKRAAAFDMPVAYTSRHPAADVPWRFEPSLLALAESSAILVVCTAASAATRGMVDRGVLEALGPDGILINVARGSVVDEPALVAALATGRLGGAGLDVFADEPRVPEALFAMDQVVLEPHQASATHETRQAMGQLVVDNLTAHFAGKPPLTPVV